MYRASFIIKTACRLCLLWPLAAAAADIWPMHPARIMNTLSTLQFYGPTTPGFHHGLDLMAPAGTPVVSPVSGTVSTGYYYERRTPYTYEIAVIDGDGYRWEFHHLDPSTVPAIVEDKAAAGGRVEEGELIGRVYDASAMNIKPHVHVNVVGPDGYYHNPLRFLPPLPDEAPPVIRGLYVQQAEGGNLCLSSNEALPAGSYDLVIDAYDILPPASLEQSLYGLEVQLDGKSVQRFRFDRLPRRDFLEGVDEIYHLAPVQCPGESHFRNQVDAGTPRRFLYNVPLDAAGVGQSVRIRAMDFAGNETVLELSIEHP